MPIKTGDLTPREARFVEEYVAQGNVAKAEKLAGYAPGGGRQVARRPEIQSRIAQEQLMRLTMEGAPLAVNTLFEIMRNAKAPAAARIQAAKIVLDRAMPDAASGAEKEIHEMSAAEIAEAIAAFEARIIDVTPSDPIPAAPSILE